jgi:hypothetical protein
MTAIELVKPWRITLGIVPAIYAGVVIAALPQSRTWLLLVCSVVFAATIVANLWEYPLLALWPTFVGIFVLSVCAIVLVINAPEYTIAPLTGSSAEIPAAAFVGIGLIFWGIATTGNS